MDIFLYLFIFLFFDVRMSVLNAAAIETRHKQVVKFQVETWEV